MFRVIGKIHKLNNLSDYFSEINYLLTFIYRIYFIYYSFFLKIFNITIFEFLFYKIKL